MITTFIAAFAVMFGAQSAVAYGSVYSNVGYHYVAGRWYDSFAVIYTEP